MFRKLFTLAFVIISVADFISSQEQDCDIKFWRYSRDHTACLQSETPISKGVTDYQKEYIVSRHNFYRDHVHKFNDQPEATNMQRMYWDDELAMIAQKWADHCTWEHDKGYNRAVPGSYSVGQNLGRGYQTWGEVIKAWQSEVQFLKFGVSGTPGEMIGHYTQLVWAESARVGCGFTDCGGGFRMFVCNYAPSGNFVSSQFSPYKAGTRGEDCGEEFKVSGLCDCGGKVCKNGGKLNLKTCQCECNDRPWIYGDDCSLDCSKADDLFICETKGGSWKRDTCQKFSNVPYEYCPVMCNLCPDPDEVVPSPPAPPPSSTTTKPTNKPTTKPTTESTTEPTTKPTTKPTFKPTTKPTTKPTFKPATESTTKQTTRATTAGSPPPPPKTTPSLVTTEEPTVVMTTKPEVRTTWRTKMTTKPARVTTTTVAPPPPTEPSLNSCSSIESAQCGQLSTVGYYPRRFCISSGIANLCPAMCGRCAAQQCQDYDGNIYGIGEEWFTQFGTFTCTAGGVTVERGCYLNKANVVIDVGQTHQYEHEDILWTCSCRQGYSQNCQGIRIISTTTTTTTTTPETITSRQLETGGEPSGLPPCGIIEESTCGQPVSSYWPREYCQYDIVSTQCPAMCGRCAAQQCKDSGGRIYNVGEEWLTRYGKFTCTANGVTAERGCYIEKAGVVINIGESAQYTENRIDWTCHCLEGYSIRCQGRSVSYYK